MLNPGGKLTICGDKEDSTGGALESGGNVGSVCSGVVGIKDERTGVRLEKDGFSTKDGAGVSLI